MGRLKALIVIFAIVAGVYVGNKVIPVYYNNYAFQNELDTVALNESYSQRTETQLRDVVARIAGEYNIPVTADQIVVRRNGRDLSISTEYTIHIDVPIHPFDLSFAPASKNHVP